MKTREARLAQATSREIRTFKKHFSNSQTLVVNIQVSQPSLCLNLVDIDCSEAFSWRGKCYMHLLEYKRALYDFSAAIRAEGRVPGGGSPSFLAEFYMYAGQCNQMLGQYEEALAHY